MNEFIKTQQELAREEVFNQWPYTAEFNKELMYPWIDTLIQQIITNTGEELLRRAEGEKRTADEIPDTLTDIWQKSHNAALDTIKHHITSLTGVE